MLNGWFRLNMVALRPRSVPDILRNDQNPKVIAMKRSGPELASPLCRLLIGGALAVALAFVRAASASAADVTEMKIGLSSAGNTSLALLMAKQAGFFAERGMNVDF